MIVFIGYCSFVVVVFVGLFVYLAKYLEHGTDEYGGNFSSGSPH
jgi:hypothetical protein